MRTSSSYVLEGELVLVEDGGETLLRAGDCAAFAKDTGNGHHMINRSDTDRGLSRGRLAPRRRRHHLLRHRHDEHQRRRPLPAQGWHALSRAVELLDNSGRPFLHTVGCPLPAKLCRHIANAGAAAIRYSNRGRDRIILERCPI